MTFCRVVALGLIVLVGCMPPTSIRWHIPPSYQYDVPKEFRLPTDDIAAATAAVIAVYAKNRWLVSGPGYAEGDSDLFRMVSSGQFSLSSDQGTRFADCGRIESRNDLERLKATHGSSTSLLTKRDRSVFMKVNTRFMSSYFKQSLHRTVPVDCLSRGTFERDFYDRVIDELDEATP